MSKFKGLLDKVTTDFTFGDIESIVEERPRVVLVKLTNSEKTFGISKRRLNASSKADDIKLIVDSHEGKYLIPEDSIETQTPDW